MTYQNDIATKRATRLARKLEKLGSDAACEECGETEILCLHQVTSTSGEHVLCATCRARTKRKQSTEAHHVMGQHNDPFTVAISPNDHAILSDHQYDWPQETLRNPHGSPLRIIAALLRGWIDLLELVGQHALQWVAFLESLDTYLCSSLGLTWWAAMPSKGPTS